MPLVPRTPEERYVFYQSDAFGDDDSMNFQIERTDRQNKFFSQGPLEDLFDNVRLFIGARMMRRYHKTGKTPSKMVVKISIEFED